MSPGVAYAIDASRDVEATIATIVRHKPLIGKRIPNPQKNSLVFPLISVLAIVNDLVRVILRSLSYVI